MAALGLTSLGLASLGPALPASAAGAPPTAVNDTLTVAEGGTTTTLTGGVTSVLANDTDPESEPLMAVLVAAPEYGTVDLHDDGTFSYTHDGGERATDSFAYRAFDGTSFSAVAVVGINVTPVNDAPVAVNDSYAVGEDSTLTVTAANRVTTNDTDAEGDFLSTTLVSGVSHGSLTFNANGTFTYVPAADYSGPDSFTYRALDGSASSNVATVSITVTPVNDPPVAVAESLTVPEGGTATTLTGGATSVLANDTDPENDALTAVLVTGPAHGTLTLNPNGTFAYTHDGDETTSDSFTYRATDGASPSSAVTVSITVTPVNDAPVAHDDAMSVVRGGTATVLTSGATSLLANDTDAENDLLGTVSLVTAPTHGTAVVSANGMLSYTHDGSATGSDSLAYRVSDGTSFSNVATLTITVTEPNRAPVTVADALTVAEGGTATTLTGGATSVLANDTDADGDVLSAVLGTGPAHGTLTLNPDGTFSYVHDGGETSADSFTYRASDGTAQSSAVTVSITVSPVNDAPRAVDDSYSTAQDTVLAVTTTGRVTANDVDVDGDPLSTVLATGPAHGTLVLDPAGTFVYTPAAGYSGSDFFTYRADDGTSLSDPATVTLTIVAASPPVPPTPAPPTPTPPTPPIPPGQPDEGPSISGLIDRLVRENGRTGELSFTIADDRTAPADLVVTATSDNRRLLPRSAIVLTGDGARRQVQLTPVAGRAGTAVVTLRVTDAAGASDTARITLTVLKSRSCTITGTDGDDALVGTPGPDVICGGGGDDVIRGLGGDDVLRGGDGADLLVGGDGDDVLVGAEDDDVLRGGSGDDVLLGGAGDDELRGGTGRNAYRGGPGRDSTGGADRVRADA